MQGPPFMLQDHFNPFSTSTGLNKKASKNVNCVQEGAEDTGVSWARLAAHIAFFLPFLIILENLADLLEKHRTTAAHAAPAPSGLISAVAAVELDRTCCRVRPN